MPIATAANALVNDHPGAMLRQEYLDELGISPYKLAKATGLTQTHVSELLDGKKNITAATALLLAKFFDTSAEFWLNLQNRYDLVEARRNMAERLDLVRTRSSG